MAAGKVRVDVPLMLAALSLTVFGILTVYSAGQTEVVTAAARAYRSQVVWFGIALVAAYAVSRASLRMVEWLTVPLYALSLLMLVMLFIPGLGTGAGTAASTKSWLAIGGFRIGQPSELAKITVVLMLARVLANRREAPRAIVDLWKPALVVGVPWLLIMAQPDLGTGLVFIGILFGMLFWFGAPWPLLVLVASPGISLVLAYDPLVWGIWFMLLLALVLTAIVIGFGLLAFSLVLAHRVHATVGTDDVDDLGREG